MGVIGSLVFLVSVILNIFFYKRFKNTESKLKRTADEYQEYKKTIIENDKKLKAAIKERQSILGKPSSDIDTYILR